LKNKEADRQPLTRKKIDKEKHERKEKRICSLFIKTIDPEQAAEV
jgi:hypothetical protein